MFWLLLTGQVPTTEQTRALSKELAEKGELPKYIEELIDSYVSLCIYTLRALTQDFSVFPPLSTL